MSTTHQHAATVLALALCAAAPAQVRQDTSVQPAGPAVTPAQPQGLQRVEPGVGDVDPLRASLRDLSVDLRASGDFSSPYRLQGQTPADDRFVRYGGGTTAVFSRSVYTPTRRGGVHAEIPPGTVFYIGDVPAPQPWERTYDGTPPQRRLLAPPPMSAERADVRLNTAAATVATGAQNATEPQFLGTRALLMRAADTPAPEPESEPAAESQQQR